MTSNSLPSLDLPAPYHIGIVVRDVDAAIERYRAVLGVREWRVQDLSGENVSPWHWHGEPQDNVGMKVAYSVGEFPLLEFIEPTTDAESSANAHLRDHGEGIFHLGYFVDDVPGMMECAKQLGVAVESYIEDEDGVRVAYLDPKDVNGLRIELVSTAVRQRLMHWVETGEWTAA